MEGYPYQFSGDPRTVTHVTMPPSQPPVVYSPYVTHPSSPPAFYPTQLPPYPTSAPYTPVYVQPQLQHPPPQLLQQQQHPNPLQPTPQQHLLHQQQHPVQQIPPQQEHPNPLQPSPQQHLHLQHHPPSIAPREMILILPPAAPTLTTMVRPSLMTTMVVSKTATITSAAAVSQSSVTSVLTTTLPPDPEMEAVFRKFAEVVQAAEAIEATDEQVLNVFLQLTKKERKLVMAEGSIRSFLSKCDYITVTGNTLSLAKLPPSRLHDVNNAGIVFEHSVYKSKDSAVELFEDRAYRCGISLEKDGVDSEESVNSISQSSHCQSDPKVAVAYCQDQISNGHRPHACTTKWSVAAGEVTDDLLTTQLVKSKGQSVATLKTTYTPLTYAADYKNRLSDSESADECDNISSSNKGKDMNVARGHFVSMRSALQQFKETLFVKSSDPVDTVAKRLVYDAMCGALDKVTRSRKSYPTSKQNHVLRAESSTFVPRTRPALAASSSNQLNASSPEFRPQSAISLERGSSGDALSHRGVCSVPSLRLQRCVSTYNCGVQTETLPQTSVMTNTKRHRTKDCGTQTPPQPCCDVAINTTDSLFDHRFRYHLVPIVTTTDTGVNTTKINRRSLKSQCSVPSEDESTMTLEDEALQVRQRTVSEIEDGNVRSMATLVRTDSEQSADGIEPTLATADVSGQPPGPSLKEAAYKKPPGLPNIQQPVKKSKKAVKALKAKTLALKAEVVSEETADICPANTAAVRPSNVPVLPIQPVGESRRTEPVNPTADSEEREWEDSADPHVSTPTDLTISTMTHNDPLLQQMMLTLLKVNPALSADPRLLQMTAMSHMVALQQMQQQQQQQQSVQQQAIHDLQQPAIHDPQQPAIHDPQQPMIHDTQQPMIHDQHQRVIHDLQQPMIHDTQQAMIHDLHQRVIHDPQQPMIHDTQQPMIHDQHQRVIHDPQQPMIHDPQLDPQLLVIHDPRQPMIHNQQQPVIHDPQQLVFHDQQQLMIHDPHQTELLQKQQQLQLLQQQQQQMQQQQQLRHRKWMEMQHRSVETPESNSSSQGRILETPPYRELHTQPESVATREMLPLQPSEHDPSNLRPPQNWPSQQESTERRPSQLKSRQDVRSQLEHPQAASTKVRPSKLRPTAVPEPSQRATNTRNSGQTDVPSPTDNGGRPELRGKVVPSTQDDVKQQSVVQPGHRVSGFLGRVPRKTTVANTAAMIEFSTSRNLNNGNVHERSTEMASGEDWDTEIDPYMTTWKMNEVPLPESVKEPPKPPIPGLVQKPSKKKGVMTQDVNPQPVTPVKVAPPPQTQAPQRSFPGNFFKKPPALVTPTLIPISSLANRGESESRLNLADNSAFPGLPSHRQQKKACVSSSMSELSDISLKPSTTDSVSLLCNIPMSSVASLGFSGVADTLLGQQGGDMFEDFDISSHANWQPVVGKKKKGDHIEKQMNSFEKLIVKMKEMHPDATQAVLHDAIKQVRQKHAGLKGVHMSQVISDASKIIGSARSTDSVGREGGDATDPVNKINYKTRICQFWQSGTCVQGDQCGYAHGKKELRQMPRKTQMCQNILKGYCQFGDQCSFAHSEDELKKSKPQAQQTKPAPLPKVLRPMKSAKPTPAPAITPSWGGWSDTSGSRPTHVTELDEMDDVECVICCDGIKPKDSKMLECGHVFHDKCIRQWVLGVGTRTCPTCRSHALLAEDFPKLG